MSIKTEPAQWRSVRFGLFLKALLLAAVATTLFGCASNGKVQNAPPKVLYKQAKELLGNANYPRAIKVYLKLQARYPFSPQTRQAELDLIYAYYKNKQAASALDAAEQFVRENPTNPRVDYALYMKGIIQFDPAPNPIEELFNIDLAKRPPKDTMKSYRAFQQLIRRFPNSPYVSNARKRMLFLRNRLAAYENYVAEYYMRRGAYVAAVNRAKYAIEHYPGAPQLKKSLQIMVSGYRSMGMDKLAEDAERVYQLNEDQRAAASAGG